MLFSDNQALMSIAQTKTLAFDSLLTLRSRSSISSDMRAHAETIYTAIDDSYQQFVIGVYGKQEAGTLDYHRSVVQSGTEALVQTAREQEVSVHLSRFLYS